jgi:hypothetical protein
LCYFNIESQNMPLKILWSSQKEWLGYHMCRKTHEPDNDHTFPFVVWKICLHGSASTSRLRHCCQFVSVNSMCFEYLHWLKGFEMVQLNIWYEHLFHQIRTTHKRIWYYFETTIVYGDWLIRCMLSSPLTHNKKFGECSKMSVEHGESWH